MRLIRGRAKLTSARGFSLVEVLVAVVILGIAGAAIIHLLQSSTQVNRNVSNKTLAISAMNTASNALTTAPFAACTPGNSGSLYSSISLPQGVSIKKRTSDNASEIYGLASNGAWVNCKDWTSSTSPKIQKITLEISYASFTGNGASTTATNMNALLLRDVIKTSAGNFGTNKIKVNTTTLNLVSGGPSQTVTLDVSPLACADTFIFTPTVATGITVNISNCAVTFQAVRGVLNYPFTPTASYVISGVELATNKLLLTSTINVNVSFPTPTITNFAVTTPVGGNYCYVGSALQCGVTGNTVTITGTNLLGNPDNLTLPPLVKFNGTTAVVSGTPSDTSITVTVPASVSTGRITVRTQGGTATSATDFTVIPLATFNETAYPTTDPDTDVITYSAFDPSFGGPGTSVTIKGTNLGWVIGVKFTANKTASFLVTSNTQITTTAPDALTTGPITLTTAAGSTVSLTNFSPTPVITKLSGGGIKDYTNKGTTLTTNGGYGAGITGASFDVTGTGFATATLLEFSDGSGGWVDGSNCGFPGATNTSFYWDRNTISDTKIKVCAPSTARTGPIRVTNPYGTGTSAFWFHPEPIITTTSPTTGAGLGVAVTINGTGFSGVTAVKFGGVQQSVITSKTDSKIVLNVPASAQNGVISVTTPIDTATTSSTFYVTPRVTSLSSTSLNPGSTVTITGTGFTGITTNSGTSTQVFFNGTAAKNVVFTSDTSISANVPCSGATSGPIKITTSLGDGYSSDVTIGSSVPTPSITSAGSNAAGDDQKWKTPGTLTIKGTNLGCVTGIKWNSSSLTSFSGGSTTITATLPGSATTSAPIVLVSGSTEATSSMYLYAPIVVTKWTATSGVKGTGQITITGTGFGADSAKFGTDVYVKIGTKATAVGDLVSISDTSLTFKIPAAASNGNQTIKITTPYSTDFTVQNSCTSCANAAARAAATTSEVITLSSSTTYGYFWFATGQVLTVSGFTTTANNGADKLISATNSGTFTVTITNTSVTAAASTGNQGTITQSKIVVS